MVFKFLEFIVLCIGSIIVSYFLDAEYFQILVIALIFNIMLNQSQKENK